MFDRKYLLILGEGDKYWGASIHCEKINCGFYDFSHVSDQPFQTLDQATAHSYADKYGEISKLRPVWIEILPFSGMLTPQIVYEIAKQRMVANP